MKIPTAEAETDSSAAEETSALPRRGRLGKAFTDLAMRYSLLRRGLGIYAVYRVTNGGLIASGLAYATLFALIPTLALAVVGLTLLVGDEALRTEAVEFLTRVVPVLKDIATPVVDGAVNFVTIGSLIALIGFGWAASGLYLNLTRAMESFFPGERVSGALARLAGVLLVGLIIVGVLAAVVVDGMLEVVARALQIDQEWLVAVASAVVTLATATGITYGVYRAVPAAPPAPASARLPAVLVGVGIGLMTLFYGFVANWLTSSYAMFGVMASVFVALVWLRLIFITMTYGAAMARYLDLVATAHAAGAAEPDAQATAEVLRMEAERARLGRLGALSLGAVASAEERRPS